MQGPEPSTMKMVDVTNEPTLVQNLALDQWYDFYARAPSNATGDAGVGVFTLDLPGFPQPNNPEQYHIWRAEPGGSPICNTAGVDGLAAGPISAGQAQYMGSLLFTSHTNTAHPPNPSPVAPGGGGGGGGGWPFPFPDLGSLTPEQLLLIAGGGVVVLGVIALALGGGD
jgi:hypothetical protein